MIERAPDEQTPAMSLVVGGRGRWSRPRLVVAGLLVLAMAAAGVLGVTRFATASQDRAERAYLDTSKVYKAALKLDVLQLTGCGSAKACRAAMGKALADNDSYLQWARNTTVPGRFRQAHVLYLKGASLHRQGAHDLLALWASPPATQEQFNKLFEPAADLLKQGDAATDAGDALMSAAGFAIP